MSRLRALGGLLALAVCFAGAIWTASHLSPASSPDVYFSEPTDRTSGVRAQNEHLHAMQAFLLPTLEANRKSFSGRQGLIKGFGAGESYPQVWLRDNATLIPVSRFYYPAEYLTSWLEEHLSHQQGDGQLYDWIAAGPAAYFVPNAPRAREIFGRDQSVLSADKNTIEADQESSAVLAAHEIFQVTGDRAWLRKEIAGAPLIERLAAGLEYLIEKRSDPDSGLIVSGFSADWGDVSPLYDDARAIYLDHETPRVIGLYTNDQFYFACRRLGEMYEVLEERSRANSWRDLAARAAKAINDHLWQVDKGFYRMHAALTLPLATGWPDDANRFAMGGNALAVLYGIADHVQAKSIFGVAASRGADLGLSTASGSLLPPYPPGFFAHPLMREAYSYQNGGQWDWFGGRFVLAEFERGFSEQARRHLFQIADKVASNGALDEWQTKEGQGRGSRHYAGSAGALGAASFQGLFGVYLRAGALEIRVRLGERPGEIQLFQPATGTFIRYRYRYDVEGRELSLNYESNAEAEGSLSILLPRGVNVSRLWIDGVGRSFSTQSLGEDEFLAVSTDWNAHKLRAQLN